MSRLNPDERPINPSTRFLEWSGKKDKGYFTYFDKEQEEKEKGTGKTAIPLPFTFIVLDELITVSGFSDEYQKGYYSNEIRKKNIKTDVLKVRRGKDLVQEGVWDEIKGKESGMKYCASVYIAYIGSDKKLAIGNIKMMGSCLNAWIDFTSGVKADKAKGILASPAHNPFKGTITVSEVKDKKKGSNEYVTPIFSQDLNIKPKTEAEVIELCKTLEAYLVQYFEAIAPEELTSAGEVLETTSNAASMSAKEIAMAKQAEVSKSSEDSLDLPW